MLYWVLFIFGTLIYLDVRGYAWCVPVNRASRLFSGMAASYILVMTAGLAPIRQAARQRLAEQFR